MNKLPLHFPFLALLLLFTGCAGTDTSVPVSRMAAQLRYHGFDVKRPADSRWISLRSEQSPHFASFRLPLDSPTHSLFAQIRHEKLPAEALSSAAFKRYVDRQNKALGSRHELISYQSSLGRKQGQPAVIYQIKTLDKKPANSDVPLVMKIKGYSVLHPFLEGTIIDANVSERGTRSEVDGTFDALGTQLIDGVVLKSSPQDPSTPGRKDSVSRYRTGSR